MNHCFQSRNFRGKSFEEFREVRVLRLDHGLETEVADMLREPTVDLLPAPEVDPDGPHLVRRLTGFSPSWLFSLAGGNRSLSKNAGYVN